MATFTTTIKTIQIWSFSTNYKNTIKKHSIWSFSTNHKNTIKLTITDSSVSIQLYLIHVKKTTNML